VFLCHGGRAWPIGVLTEPGASADTARHAAPVLVYDGSCGFCLRWVRRIQRWDRSGVIRYLPLQDDAAPVVTGRSRQMLRQAVHFVRSDGTVFAGAAAGRALWAYLPGGWVPEFVAKLPGVMPAAERVYRFVARRWGPVGSP
jgi:acetyl esterase